jgi:hypothetical protein
MTEPSTPLPAESAAPRPPSGTPAPPAAEGGGETRLATYPPNVLVVGDHTITPEGTAVPTGEVDDIYEVATKNGVRVYEKEA